MVTEIHTYLNKPAVKSWSKYVLLLRPCIKDTLKAFDDFKNKQKSVWSNVFWYVKVCIFWKCIQYTIHWDKTQMFKKSPSDKLNDTKMPLFFFRELQLITVSLLICNFYMSWSTRLVSLKLCVEFSIFDSVSFL